MPVQVAAIAVDTTASFHRLPLPAKARAVMDTSAAGLTAADLGDMERARAAQHELEDMAEEAHHTAAPGSLTRLARSGARAIAARLTRETLARIATPGELAGLAALPLSLVIGWMLGGVMS